MWTREKIFTTLRAELPYLATEFGVRRIGLFGSHAKGSQGKESDIDLLAEFDDPPGLRFVELVEHLESIFQTSVDLLTPAGVAAIRDPRVASSIRESVVYELLDDENA